MSNFLIKAKKNMYHTTPAKYFGNKKLPALGLDEISTFEQQYLRSYMSTYLLNRLKNKYLVLVCILKKNVKSIRNYHLTHWINQLHVV